ncbi:MAG: hypothetical protein ACREQV_08485, partial [Candidatus Binatia bacterium]
WNQWAVGSRGWLRVSENMNPFIDLFLNEWPMERLKDWIEFVNEPGRESELDDLRLSAQRVATSEEKTG